MYRHPMAMKDEKPLMGRPPIPDSERKESRVSVRVRSDDKERMERLARQSGASITEWARLGLLKLLKEKWKP